MKNLLLKSLAIATISTAMPGRRLPIRLAVTPFRLCWDLVLGADANAGNRASFRQQSQELRALLG